MEYLSTPDTGPVPFNGFSDLQGSIRFVFRCGQAPLSAVTQCLSAGEYTARSVYRVIDGAGTVDVAVPVRLTVAP